MRLCSLVSLTFISLHFLPVDTVTATLRFPYYELFKPRVKNSLRLPETSEEQAKVCNVTNVDLVKISNIICQTCHEAFNYDQDPDMHAKCRSNCFNNKYFRYCLSVFADKRGST